MSTTVEYAMLSLDAYNFIDPAKTGPAPQLGWTVSSFPESTAVNGFGGRVYVDPNDAYHLVIAVAGTNDLADVASDAAAYFGTAPSQLQDAIDYYNALVTSLGTNASNYEITLTGHSLGGALASAVAYLQNTTAEVFDAIPTTGWLAAFVAQSLGHNPADSDYATIVSNLRDDINLASGIADHRMTGDIASYLSGVTTSDDYAGWINGTAFLPSLDDDHDRYVGTWTGVNLLDAAPGSTAPYEHQMALALHSVGLMNLAVNNATSFDGAIDAQPFFIRQLVNESFVPNVFDGAAGDLHAALAAQDIGAGTQASIFDGMLGDVIASTKIGLSYANPEDQTLATALSQIAVAHAAFELPNTTPDVDGVFSASYGGSGGQLGTLVIDTTQIDATSALSGGLAGVQDWLDAKLTAAGIEIDPSLSVGQFVEVQIANESASASVTGDSHESALIGSGLGGSIVGGEDDELLISFGGNSSLSGGAGDDHLYSGAGNDSLMGGDGADSLDGGAGNDTLNGGNGADSLVGGSGGDILTGGDDDVVDGGGGADTLAATGRATLVWSGGNDHIDATALGYPYDENGDPADTAKLVINGDATGSATLATDIGSDPADWPFVGFSEITFKDLDLSDVAIGWTFTEVGTKEIDYVRNDDMNGPYMTGHYYEGHAYLEILSSGATVDIGIARGTDFQAIYTSQNSGPGYAQLGSNSLDGVVLHFDDGDYEVWDVARI